MKEPNRPMQERPIQIEQKGGGEWGAGKGSFAAPVPAFWSMERSETVAERSGDRM